MHYYEQIWAIVLEVLQLPDEDYGLHPHVIARAEHKLGFKLPPYLSAFYQQFGKLPQLTHSHSQFANPDQLQMLRGALLFSREYEGHYFWAIQGVSLEDTDPPVVQGNNGEDAWYPYADSLQAFLNGMACWQAVHSLRSKATGPLTTALLHSLDSSLNRVDSVATGPKGGDLAGYYSEGLVVCAFPKQANFYVAAHDDSVLSEFEQTFSVSLSWL